MSGFDRVLFRGSLRRLNQVDIHSIQWRDRVHFFAVGAHHRRVCGRVQPAQCERAVPDRAEHRRFCQPVPRLVRLDPARRRRRRGDRQHQIRQPQPEIRRYHLQGRSHQPLPAECRSSGSRLRPVRLRSPVHPLPRGRGELSGLRAEGEATLPARPHRSRLLCVRPPGLSAVRSQGSTVHGSGYRAVQAIPDHPGAGNEARDRGPYRVLPRLLRDRRDMAQLRRAMSPRASPTPR